jgi:hypothetical protein
VIVPAVVTKQSRQIDSSGIVFPREKILFDRIYVQQPAVSKDQFEVYFKFAKNVVEEIIEATPYRHGNHCVLQADQKDLSDFNTQPKPGVHFLDSQLDCIKGED